MISKNKARFIISLQRKKTREEEKLFVIEGDKLVKESLAAGLPVKLLVAKPEFLKSLSPDLVRRATETEEASYDDLKKVSSLTTPHNALAVVEMQENKYEISKIAVELNCALEFVQDPGNLGTILRAAAWFGIRNIICSPDSVDAYNPKVIQASMGAFMLVNTWYCDLTTFLGEIREMGKPVFGTILGGTSIYEHPLGHEGVILLGNESKGISPGLHDYITQKITIPGAGNIPGLDSLNVGMAASVVFSEFRRRRG